MYIKPNYPLTKREQEILRLLALGKRRYEIAHKLCISQRVVQNYISFINEKLGTESATQAVAWAWRTGFVTHDHAYLVH